MFVAVDTTRGDAVTGEDVHSDRSPGAANGGSGYRCLFCDASLSYTASPDEPRGHFVHDSDRSCLNNGNVSSQHRLGQEVVAKEVFNLLPTAHELIQMDLERQIGARSTFVIADVRVTAPVRLAVEVVYLSGGLDLQRRLQTLFAQGYAGMIVVLTDGVSSPERINRHLRKVGEIRVGRFDPHSFELHVGSVVTPERIDLHSPRWNSVPAYLA